MMVNNPVNLPKNILPVKPVDGQKSTQKIQPAEKGQTAFSEVLKEKLQEIGSVKLSAHAATSLEKRNINLSRGDMLNINEAVKKAEAKGSKDSLFLMGDLALIVSIKNKTVVTAIDRDHLKDNLFTKIDSAIILDSESKE
jgi:flagellar operon protein